VTTILDMTRCSNGMFNFSILFGTYVRPNWRGSSVGIEMGYSWKPQFDFQRGQKTFLFSTGSRPALGSTQPPIWRLPGASFRELKWPSCEPDHSSPSSAEVKNGEAMPPLPHTVSWNGPYLINHRYNITYGAHPPFLFMDAEGSFFAIKRTKGEIDSRILEERLITRGTFTSTCVYVMVHRHRGYTSHRRANGEEAVIRRCISRPPPPGQLPRQGTSFYSLGGMRLIRYHTSHVW
jgi:hypothetical protein